MNDAKKAAAPGRLHRSALNAASGLAGWVIPVLINVVTAPVLLHHLGAEGYGVLSLGALLVGYFAIADMGLDIAVVKYVAEFDAQGEKDELNRLLSASMQINFVIGLLGLAVALMLAPYLSERVFAVPTSLQSQAVTVFRLAGAGFFASMVISWGSAIIQGLQRYDLLNVLSAANNGVGVMAGLAAVLAGYGVVGFMAMRVLTSFCVGLCYIVAARRLLPNLKLQFGIDPRAAALIRRVAGFGVLLRVTGMVSVMSDRTLIGIWLGTATLSNDDPIYRISPQGAVSAAFEHLARPQGLAFDPDGNLCVIAICQGERGVFRLGANGSATLAVAGENLVGLTFDRECRMVLASTNAVYRLSGAAR